MVGRMAKNARLTDEQEEAQSRTVQHYKCPICLSLPDDGLVAQCCEKVYCRTCLNRHFKASDSTSCPHCREHLDPQKDLLDLKENRLPWNVFSGLTVSCGIEACPWKGQMDAYEAHATKHCAFRLVKCETCSVELVFHAYKAHQCEMRAQICTFCEARVPGKFMAAHKRGGDDGCLYAFRCLDCQQLVQRTPNGHACPKKRVPCGICSEQVPRDQLLDHDRKMTGDGKHAPWSRALVQQKAELEETVRRLVVECQVTVRRGMAKPEPKKVHLDWTAAQLKKALEAKDDDELWIHHQRVLDMDTKLVHLGVRDQTQLQLVRGAGAGDAVHVSLMLMDTVDRTTVARVHNMTVRSTATPRHLFEKLVALGEVAERLKYMFHGATRLDTKMDMSLSELALLPLDASDHSLYMSVREK